jgi:hypothetical protein
MRPRTIAIVGLNKRISDMAAPDSPWQQACALGRWLGEYKDEGDATEQERTDSLRAKTVGYLLHELRARVGIDDTFESVLSKFLAMRNTVVHNIDEIPGWSLDSEDGIAVAHSFLVTTHPPPITVGRG